MLATELNGDLGIEVFYLDRGVDVELRGELDIATAPALREHLSEVVTHGWIDIAIDIAELRYIDWPGLSVLIMTQKRVEEMNGSLVVRHPTKAALKLFDTTGLTARLISTGRASDLIRLEAAKPR
jgi:anti-anti-sigma factor